jgi:hypothetical protein
MPSIELQLLIMAGNMYIPLHLALMIDMQYFGACTQIASSVF